MRHYYNRMSSKKNNDEDDDNGGNKEILMVGPGTEAEVLSDDLWEEIEDNKPSKWMIIKNVRYLFFTNHLLAE